MIKTFSFFSIFLFSSLLIFAQNNSGDFDKWKIFSPEGDEFSIKVPPAFKAYYSSTDKKNRRYSGVDNGIYYFIFTDKLKEPEGYKVVSKFIELYQKADLEKQKNSDKMNFEFSDEEGFFHFIYIAKTKNHIYTIQTVSSVKDNSQVKQFFKSLKINEQPVTVEPTESQTKIESENGDDNPLQSENISSNGSGSGYGIGNGKGVGSGSGSGSGSGFGPGENNAKTPSDEKIADKMLNIIFKAKPQYNDFARFYQITGNVRVRTTFLKDGQIGSVNPVSKLPFGLTQSAVTAAKQLRFEPQIQNGQKVTVTKVVVFTFTIF